MNYTPLAIKKLKDFSQQFPDYSFGELIYSMLSTMSLESKDLKYELIKMDCEDVFVALNRAMRLEHEPEEIQEEV